MDEKSMGVTSVNGTGNVDGTNNANASSQSQNNIGTIAKSSSGSVPLSSRWTDADEDLLKEWADHAMCFHWLHEQAYIKFNNIYTYINIPIIIISTITGTANFAQSKISDNFLRDIMAMVIGIFSISAGILATSLSFFKIGERKESHNNCAKLWDKLHRNIQMELTKPVKERMNKKTMLELTKKEYDRLIDDSPLIPAEIVVNFNTKFKNNPTVNTINKPNVLDVFHTIRVNHYDEPDEKPESDHETYRMIEMKFRELNGRMPTDVELQNIMEMQRSSMSGGSGMGMTSIPMMRMSTMSTTSHGFTPHSSSSLNSVSIPASIRIDSSRDGSRM